MAERATLQIKHIRSGIGRSAYQRKVLRGLGLTKLNQIVERVDTPEIRGMVAKITHLVKILEKDEL